MRRAPAVAGSPSIPRQTSTRPGRPVSWVSRILTKPAGATRLLSPTPAQAPAPARTATAGPAGATEADSTAGSGADVEGAAVRGDRYHAWRGTELSIRPGRGSCPKVSITVHFEVIQKSLVILPVVEHDYPDRDVRGAAGNRNWRCPSLRLSRGLFWVGGSICGVLILIS